MPTSLRMASMFFRLWVSSVPSTITLPSWCSSSRLMQRISVDFPEPDGPQMTMRSRSSTVRSMSRSTWKVPNHLLSPEISMIGSAMPSS